jgi:hypothetical protein
MMVGVTIKQHLDDLAAFSDGDPLDISDEVREEIIKKDVIVKIYLFTDTLSGHYQIIHHDINAAIDVAWNLMKELGKIQS